MVAGVHGKTVKALGIIPARYQSSRFPGKPLVEILGVPMLKRTYMQAMKSEFLSDLVIATDDEKIFDYCVSENMPVTMTSSSCLTGTDRLAEVVLKEEYNHYDIYINIQGDEPVIDPCVISQLIEEYKKNGNQYIAYNLYKIINDESEINSDTIIKVIVNEKDELMYMSRLPVPFSKSEVNAVHRQQIPVYGYTFEALELFSKYKKTINEQFEDIELLRFVDLGYKIKMSRTEAVSTSVDVPDDINKILKILGNKKT